MVTTVEEYNKQLHYVIEGLRQRLQGGDTVFPAFYGTFNMDKPIKVFTANVEDWKEGLQDCGDHYEMMYPRFGDLRKHYTNDFCWIIDKDTVFVIERPFKNRVIKFLQELLPNHKVHTIKNDVMIDDVKIGPTCMVGAITDWTGNTENPPTSSIIYCLRWTNVEELDEIFAGDPNHEARKSGAKAPLGQLDMFIKDMTKEEFERQLENYQ